MRHADSIRYERHVDGLRAIAVLSVIAYHANPQWLPGGFVGVDIFFVISGYLITKIILREISAGKFSFSNFYKRRIKRILPLYCTVLFCTTIVGFILFLPKDIELLVQSGGSSLVFVSNMFFWIKSGYFAPESESLPLLHTWSLSVEEQYYLFWPLVLIVCFKLLPLRKYALSIFLAGSVAGIALSHYLVVRNPEFGFYSLPSRAYELLIGAIISVWAFKIQNKAAGAGLLVAGLIGLFISFYFLSSASVFPGVNGLLPTVSTAAIIVGGQGSENTFSRLLENRVMVAIGLISYSLYLWHWPVFAVSRYLQIEFTFLVSIALISVTFILSMGSYLYIEKPIIYSKLSFKTAASIFFIAPLALYFSTAYAVLKKDGFYERFSSDVQANLKQVYAKNSDAVESCIGEHHTLYLEDACLIGGEVQTQSKAEFVLWGDSHSHHFRPLMDELAQQHGVVGRQFSFWGCPPFVGLTRTDVTFGETCRQYNENVLNYIINEKIGHVVMAARWRGYVRDGQMVDMDQVYRVQGSYELLGASLRFLLEKLSAEGIQVTLIQSIPTYPVNPSICIIKNEIYPKFLAKDCRITLSGYNQNNAELHALFSNLTGEYQNLEVLSLSEHLCDAEYCYGQRDGKAMYSDKTHLTIYGSRLLAKFIDNESQLITYLTEKSPKN